MEDDSPWITQILGYLLSAIAIGIALFFKVLVAFYVLMCILIPLLVVGGIFFMLIMLIF